MTSYPDNTGFVRHSDTSAESARALDESGRADSYDRIIIDFLDKAGMDGATAEELRKHINQWFPHVHNGSINGRLSTLWRRREVVKLKDCRRTDANKRAHVYVHDRHRQEAVMAGRAMPEFAQVTGGDDDAARQIAQMLYDRMILDAEGGAVVFIGALDLAVIENLAQRAALQKN